MIACKDSVRDFLQSPHCAVNCLQHVGSNGQGAIVCKSRAKHRAPFACNTSSAFHVQHIERFSRATHRALFTCNTSSAFHVQHIERLSRATHRALFTCHMSCATWYEGTAQLFSLTEFKSHLLYCVSTLRLGEIGGLICWFYLSVAARAVV